MTKSEKTLEIATLTQQLGDAQFFYIADASTLTVERVNQLRRKCFEQGITMKVAKNTLVRKALAANNYAMDELETALHGPTALFFSDVSNAPAKLIKDFRKKDAKPSLKAAWIDSDIYLGDTQLDVLVALKSKNELIGEIVSLLQSPAKNVISGLKGGGNKLAGILKTLSER